MMNDKIIDLEIVEQSNLDLEISNNEILELETSISFPKEAPTDYSKLSNLPKINDNTLVGNLTSNDLGLQDEMEEMTNMDIERLFI